jgi:hypothetical protein
VMYLDSKLMAMIMKRFHVHMKETVFHQSKHSDLNSFLLFSLQLKWNKTVWRHKPAKYKRLALSCVQYLQIFFNYFG